MFLTFIAESIFLKIDGKLIPSTRKLKCIFFVIDDLLIGAWSWTGPKLLPVPNVGLYFQATKTWDEYDALQALDPNLDAQFPKISFYFI